MLRPASWTNPGSLLVGTGLVALGFTLWVPWAAAHRTARVEGRAEAIGRALHDAVAAQQPLDLGDPTQCAHLLARARATAAAAGERVDDLDEIGTGPGWLLLANKHYRFRIGDSPPPPELQASPGTVRSIEVTAWPGDRGGPGHTAFFWPEDGESASTRNLQKGYAGAANAPAPAGPQRRRGDASNHHPWSYRGEDDERWLVRMRPGSLTHERTRPR